MLLQVGLLMHTEHLYLYALSLIKQLGPVTVKNLIAYCGSPSKVFETPRGKLLRIPGIGERGVASIKQSDTLETAEKELSVCISKNILFLSYLDSNYPQLLKFIHNAPLFLFKKGNVDLNAQPGIAIVGTRKPTQYGKELAEQFAAFFSNCGINVVSGLAYGIDIAVHRTVLKAGGITTAVLGHGLDTIYPSTHHQKAQEMLERGGWLSEYPIGTGPDAPHFPARNRIVAGMTKAVIVIEAAEKGGALITAQMAFEQNREVYAVPGRIGDVYSEGCNALIRNNIAKIITHPQEVLDDLSIQWKLSDEPIQEKEPQLDWGQVNADEAKVLNLLVKNKEITIDELSRQSGLPVGQLNPMLLAMEFKGLVIQLPGKKFRLGSA